MHLTKAYVYSILWCHYITGYIIESRLELATKTPQTFCIWSNLHINCLIFNSLQDIYCGNNLEYFGKAFIQPSSILFIFIFWISLKKYTQSKKFADVHRDFDVEFLNNNYTFMYIRDKQHIHNNNIRLYFYDSVHEFVTII